ncbi:MAG TPA: hypothetical protein VJX67_20945 [Blastocatellia bacterium]|nr:hypothetical protein [Blastocatellia bacterium]
MKLLTKLTVTSLLIACLVGGAFAAKIASADDNSGPGETQSSATTLPALPQILPTSTIPANGDVNPYGVAFVPNGFPQGPILTAGDILVSNFNNQNNQQATGTTIIKVSPNGPTSLFFQGTGLGLSTALAILKSGLVIVGNVPTMDGTCGTLQEGSLLVLNSRGVVVGTIADPQLLDSPWDMTVVDNGEVVKLFVSNVVSGTITRLDLVVHRNTFKVKGMTRIGSGFMHSCSAATFVIGPTGLAYDKAKDVLYVASTGDNAIFALSGVLAAPQDGGMGQMIYSDDTHLHGPLALVLAPNGDLLVSNGDAVNTDPNQPSEIVEFTVNGTFVSQLSVDKNPGGAFGMGIGSVGQGLFRFAAVNDNASALTTWILRAQ